MEYLTVKEYAELRGCNEQYVRKLISQSKLSVEESWGKGGNKGLHYRIPLASIEPKLQAKYRRIHSRKENAGKPKEQKPVLLPDVEHLTAKEREEIVFWKDILLEWEDYRPPGRSRKEATADFVSYLQEKYPEMVFSERILYRKAQALRESGDAALVDRRGKHGKHKKAIPEKVFEIFEYFYLDQTCKSVSLCRTLTELEIKQHPDKYDQSLLPLASFATFNREVDRSIPLPTQIYYREGEKAFKDKCGNYIERTYDDLHSNDIWVCDNHTFDIFINNGEQKKPARVYLTGFLDVRSRKMVGWYVTDAPSSDATLQALRRGIDAYGIPKMIYSDNGREFLTHDIGGRGFRKSAKTEEHEPPTILKHLQIEFRTALVKNARAKIIERAFLEIKESFSKLFEGYTGGNILERPERLKTIGKRADNFILLDDFRRYVDTYLAGWFNKQNHSGVGMNGKSRDEVYAACLYEQRMATPEELNLMMMRTTRMQTVNRGVKIKFYDEDIRFYSDELIMGHDHEKVYVRYNPDDLAEVRIYDEQDRFLCTAKQQPKHRYFGSKDEVAEFMRESRTLLKTVKAYKKQKGIEADDELELVMRRAEENLAAGEQLDPKIITPIRAIDDSNEADVLAQAVGGTIEPIDWEKALERLEKAKKE